MAKIKWSDEKCVRCGACASMAPELFELKEDKVVLKKAEVEGEELEKAKRVAEICPAGAIEIVE